MSTDWPVAHYFIPNFVKIHYDSHRYTVIPTELCFVIKEGM
jgi:hypothetical protein